METRVTSLGRRNRCGVKPRRRSPCRSARKRRWPLRTWGQKEMSLKGVSGVADGWRKSPAYHTSQRRTAYCCPGLGDRYSTNHPHRLLLHPTPTTNSYTATSSLPQPWKHHRGKVYWSRRICRLLGEHTLTSVIAWKYRKTSSLFPSMPEEE